MNRHAFDTMLHEKCRWIWCKWVLNKETGEKVPICKEYAQHYAYFAVFGEYMLVYCCMTVSHLNALRKENDPQITVLDSVHHVNRKIPAHVASALSVHGVKDSHNVVEMLDTLSAIHPSFESHA